VDLVISSLCTGISQFWWSETHQFNKHDHELEHHLANPFIFTLLSMIEDFGEESERDAA